MSTFGDLYADYYDVFYANKDYAAESAAVEAVFRAQGVAPGATVVSLGCGTMGHETRLARKGYRFIGIDRSPQMVALAEKRIAADVLADVSVREGDMRAFTVEQPVEAVVSLFNVLSYCQDVSELEAVFRHVHDALKPGGTFFFDAWYAPAVRRDPPRDRWKRFTRGEAELLRLTRAAPGTDAGTATLEIELLEIVGDRVARRAREDHTVRSWELAELEQALGRAGLALVGTSRFPQLDAPLSVEHWDIAVTARRAS